MKSFTHFILLALAIGVASWITGYFLPWWFFAVICFIGGLLAKHLGGISFFSGFFGVGIYYLVSSLLKSRHDHLEFADKIGAVLSSSMSTEVTGFTLLCVGTLLFAILGGLFCWSGTLILSSEPSLRLGSGRARNKEKSLKLDLKRYNR